MRACTLVLTLLAVSVAFAAEPPAWATKDLRAGIIGTDTSHVPAFANIFHRIHPEWRIKVVAAFKGGSPDMRDSIGRVEKFAAGIHDQFGAEIVDSIAQLLPKVDVVLLHSLDGRVHLAQATPVFKAGKRVFIDKPLASSVADAQRIAELAKETGTPFFSSSSLRYAEDIPRLRDNPSVGKVLKVEARGGAEVLYGIHGVEPMYAVMGPGCVSVSQVNGVCTGKWKDGRLGIVRPQAEGETLPLLRVTGTEGATESAAGGDSYRGLCRAIAEFFHTGKPPVEPEVTVEVITYIMAAQLSKERNGAEVTLAEMRKPPASERVQGEKKKSGAKAATDETKK